MTDGAADGECVSCGSDENIVDHHTSYDPERTVPVCEECHAEIHHGDGLSELEPRDEYPSFRPRLPVELKQRIDAVSDFGGYTSRSRFVSDAVRQKVMEVEDHMASVESGQPE